MSLKFPRVMRAIAATAWLSVRANLAGVGDTHDFESLALSPPHHAPRDARPTVRALTSRKARPRGRSLSKRPAGGGHGAGNHIHRSRDQ